MLQCRERGSAHSNARPETGPVGIPRSPRLGLAHLNYNHLHYFWVVAALGSIAKAAERLHVTPQTISGQLRTLEWRLGSPLFKKSGRKLQLTETGQVVRSYAEPMFRLGMELTDVLKKRTLRASSPLAVGVATGVPMRIAYRMLSTALDVAARTRVACHEAPIETLASLLHARKIDLAITDSVLASIPATQVRNSLVGQCGATFFCASEHAEHYRSGFPRSLDGAPFVMPTRTSAARASLSEWFRREQIAPTIVAEIGGPDLASALCESGTALFALPTAIADDAERTYRVTAVGQAPFVEHQFYAACVEGHLGRDRISAIIELARERFAVGAFPVGDVGKQARASANAASGARIPKSGTRGEQSDPRFENGAAVYRLADRVARCRGE